MRNYDRMNALLNDYSAIEQLVILAEMYARLKRAEKVSDFGWIKDCLDYDKNLDSFSEYHVILAKDILTSLIDDALEWKDWNFVYIEADSTNELSLLLKQEQTLQSIQKIFETLEMKLVFDVEDQRYVLLIKSIEHFVY